MCVKTRFERGLWKSKIHTKITDTFSFYRYIDKWSSVEALQNTVIIIIIIIIFFFIIIIIIIIT